MAIWQYKIYLLPEEEYNSFFVGKHQIEENAFDETKWWKYRNIDEIKVEFPYLPRTKSWSENIAQYGFCLLYTSPSPRDATLSRMPSSA